MKKVLKYIIFTKIIFLAVFTLCACRLSTDVKEYIERGFSKPIAGGFDFSPYNESTTTQIKYAPAGEEITLKLEINNPYSKKMEVEAIDITIDPPLSPPESFKSCFDGDITPNFTNNNKNLEVKFTFTNKADAGAGALKGRTANFTIKIKEPHTGAESIVKASVPCNSPPDISKLEIVWDGIECCFKVEDLGHEDIEKISYEVDKSGNSEYHSSGNFVDLYNRDGSINEQAWTFKPSDDIENKIYIGKQILISNSLRLEDYAGLVSEKCTDLDIEKMPEYDKLNLKFIFEGENRYAKVLPWDGICMLPNFNNIRSVVSNKIREVEFPEIDEIKLIPHGDLTKIEPSGLQKKNAYVSDGKKESKYQIKLTDEKKTVDAKFETILFPKLEEIINIKNCTFDVVDLSTKDEVGRDWFTDKQKKIYRELVKDSIYTEDNNKKLYFGQGIVYKMSGFLKKFQDIKIRVELLTYECINPEFGEDCTFYSHECLYDKTFNLEIYAGDEDKSVFLGNYKEIKVFVGLWLHIKNLTENLRPGEDKIQPQIDKNSIPVGYKNISNNHVLLIDEEGYDISSDLIKVNLTRSLSTSAKNLKFCGYWPNIVADSPRRPGINWRPYENMTGGDTYTYTGNSQTLAVVYPSSDNIQNLKISFAGHSLIVYYTQE